MKYYHLLLLLSTINIFSQESKLQQFDLSFSYGVSYIDYNYYNAEQPLSLDVPNTGSFTEFNLDYKLPKNRFIGLGFSRQLHSKYISAETLNQYVDTGLVLDNYKSTLQKTYFDLHFRTEFKNNLHFTVGIFIFALDKNNIREVPDGRNTYILRNEKNRSDDLGLFISPEYYFKLTDYVQIGLKAKLYYSLVGIENVSVLPTLRMQI